MENKMLRIGLLPIVLIVSLIVVPLPGAQPTEDEVKAGIEKGVEWLAEQQNGDGSWGTWEVVGVTALAVKKLIHHAVDPKWGLGLDSPFDDAYAYKQEVEQGLAFLFEHGFTRPVYPQSGGDPDTNGNEEGIYFQSEDIEERIYERNYNTGIMLMTICEAVELDRMVESGPLAGRTYAMVAQDAMDYLAFGQMDPQDSDNRGGWGYAASDNGVHEEPGYRHQNSDNSISGYVALGLAYAEAAAPQGCGFTIPDFVRHELDLWINYIQCADGGSGYETCPGSNILRTGNLLQQMAFVGYAKGDPRVLDALNYMENHWYDANWDPGWRGWAEGVAGYQATFTSMKGFTSWGIHEFGEPPIDWQTDFETVLLDQQLGDGSWPITNWDAAPEQNRILSSIWVLLTLQKVGAPPARCLKRPDCPDCGNGDPRLLIRSLLEDMRNKIRVKLGR